MMQSHEIVAEKLIPLAKMQSESGVEGNESLEYDDNFDRQTEPYNKSCFTFLMVLMVTTDVLILSLNPLCLVVLRHVSSISDVTKVFLTALTICDIGLGVFTAIPTTIDYIAGTWPLGHAACIVSKIMNETFFYAGLMALLMLTLERYIAIVYPFRYLSLLTVRRSRFITTCVIITTIIITGLLDGLRADSCTWKGQQEGLNNILSTLIPMVIIMVLYVHILVIAHRQAQRIAPANPLGCQQPMMRTLTTVVVIAAALLLGWVPDVVRIIVKLKTDIPLSVEALCDVLLMTNSWLNVVIYYLRNAEMRKVFCSLLSAYWVCISKCFQKE